MNGWALSMEYVSTYGRVRWDLFGGGPPLVLVHGTPFFLLRLAQGRSRPSRGQHRLRLRPSRVRLLGEKGGPGRLLSRPRQSPLRAP